VTVTDDAGLTDSAQVVVSAARATTTAPAAANNGTCPVPATPVVVSVTPATVTLQAGRTQVFTATLTNTANTAVTWEVNSVAGGSPAYGTITSDGMYTAPATVSSTLTVTITAVSAADASRSGSAQVTVTSASTSAGNSTAVGSSGGAPASGGGGGAMDGLTLLVGALALGAARLRGRMAPQP
jgi:hypothetical protein